MGETILRRAGVTQDGRPVVGWAIRERNRDSRFVAEVLRSIRWLKETYNAQSVLIPFHYEEDGEVCRHIASQLPDDTAVCLDEKYLSEDMLSIIGCMDLLVGVRLHSLIYAAIMGVPLIGISYDPKCTAFLNSVGLDKLSTRDGYTAEAFETEAARVLANGAEQTACVKRHMDELSRKLDTNEEMICAIMKDEKKTQPSAPQKNEKSGVRTAGAISIVFLLTLFAKLLGVVREMVQANIFGTGADANLYTASYNSTLYLFTTVCYALCIAAVPILTKEFAADRRRGERAANNLMTVTLLGALVVVVLWQILASTPLVGVLWDTDASELPRLVSYIRIMTCVLPVVAAAYLNVAIFQATDHYELQGSMSIPYNAFLAVFLLTLGARWGILGVVIASSCAWLLQLGMSIPYARKEHYVYRPVLDRGADYVGTYFKTAFVTVLTTSVFLFCYLIDTSTAASFNDSAVSAFYYADKLFTPLTTSVLYSISAVMFPRFNREFTREDARGYLGYIWNVTENTLLFIFPVCAMMCAFGTDIIRVIFEGGSFTAASTEMTGPLRSRHERVRRARPFEQGVLRDEENARAAAHQPRRTGAEHRAQPRVPHRYRRGGGDLHRADDRRAGDDRPALPRHGHRPSRAASERACRHGGDVARALRRARAARHGGREQADAGRQVRPDRRGRLRGLSRREPAAAPDDHGGDDPQIQKVIGNSDKQQRKKR